MKEGNNMFKYETHLHTSPVSACAHKSVRENLEYYKGLGYDGVFITNHFLDGNIGISKSEPINKQLDFYFSDYDIAVTLGKEIGIKVFLGIEMAYKGTDFLVYGLDKSFFYDHTEILDMPKKTELAFLAENGAFIVHAHPFREADYIDHIRLFPRSIHAVETINACRTDFENRMADIYADNYGFLKTAGSDNHTAEEQRHLAGMMSETPLNSEKDYIAAVRQGRMTLFTIDV